MHKSSKQRIKPRGIGRSISIRKQVLVFWVAVAKQIYLFRPLYTLFVLRV